MYLKTLVDLPDVPGKIVIQTKNNSSYVHFEYDRIYDADRKFNVPKRVVIGKIAGNDKHKMYPNPNFLKYFPAVDVSPSRTTDPDRSCCLKIGSWLAIRSIIEHYGIEKTLNPIIDKDTGFFLDLAAYSLISENNAGQYYPDYAYCHPLFTNAMHIYSDSKVSDFLNTMPEHWSVEFLNAWNGRRDHRERIYISYDSTNKNCQAGDIEIVEFGHPKDEQGLPVFNYSIAYDKTNQVPLFYEEYPGSIVDVSQLQFMLEKALSYGYRHCGFILDRGYFSKANIQYMDACGYEFVIMVKGMKDLVSGLVLEHQRSFETDRRCFIRGHRVYGKTIKAPLYADDTRERYFHIFHSSTLECSQRGKLEAKLERMEKSLLKHRGQAITFPKSYSQYYELYFNEQDGSAKTLVHWRERNDVIQRELSLCGYFAIVTSEQMTAQEAMDLYRSRDASEKLFRSDKTFLGNKSLRVHSDQAADAKVFIGFVALIIRNRLYNLLKDAMARMEKRPNYMTVPAAIKELDKIEMVRQFDGIYRLDHAVTKTQKVILEALGLDPASVQTTAQSISGVLAATGTSDKQEGS